jgi:hypothetical protein
MRIDGGCHCGHLSYEAEIDPGKVGVCPKEAFKLRGQPKIYVKTAESGNRRAQAFCPECGSRIYASAEADPQVFNLRVGAMRQRAALAPKTQAWCRSALPWVMNLGAVTQRSM